MLQLSQECCYLCLPCCFYPCLSQRYPPYSHLRRTSCFSWLDPLFVPEWIVASVLVHHPTKKVQPFSEHFINHQVVCTVHGSKLLEDCNLCGKLFNGFGIDAHKHEFHSGDVTKDIYHSVAEQLRLGSHISKIDTM